MQVVELVERFLAELVDVELCGGDDRGGGAGAGAGAGRGGALWNTAWLSSRQFLVFMNDVHCTTMPQISIPNNFALQPSFIT